MLVALTLAAALPQTEAATEDLDEYTKSDILLLDTTWTGTKSVQRGVLVPYGVTLTIENATVLFETGTFSHFGIVVDVGGRLIVRDSLLTNNQTGLSEHSRSRAWWDLFSKGIIEIERSTLKYGGDITLQLSGRPSLLRDVDLVWMSRGIHVLRTNLTDQPGWDLVMENVHIRDMPVNPGSGSADIGGAIGILNGKVSMRNITIERARTTGIFVDRSAVSRDTQSFGNLVEARDVLVIAGSPPGLSGQGALLSVRTTGDFLCDGCAFVSPAGGGVVLLSDGSDVTFRNTTFVDATTYVSLTERSTLTMDGVRFEGLSGGIVYRYADASRALLQNVSFSAGERGGVHTERARLRDMRGVWWGDASGPRDADADDGSIPAANPGLGRPVAGTIDYTGWAAAPPGIGPLRIELERAPPAVRPGTTLTLNATVRNVGSTALGVDLSTYSMAPASAAPARLQLAPGESAVAALTFTVASTVAPGVPIGATLAASAQGARVAAHAATIAAAGHALVGIASPASHATVAGIFDVTGTVSEPPPELAAPAAAGGGGTSGPQRDANGDRVDDRAQLAPGAVSVIIQHDGADEAALRGAIEAAGGTLARAFSLAPILWAVLPSEALPTLAARSGVVGIWWDEPMEPQLAYAARAARARTSREGILPNEIAIDADYAGVWRGNPVDGYEGVTGKGVLMAIIDSGIDLTHVSLDDMDDTPTTQDRKVAARVSTFSVLATEGTDLSVSSVVSPGSHGTWVAGTASGTGASFVGTRDAPLHGTVEGDPWMRAGAAPGTRLVDIDAFEDSGEVTRSIPTLGFGLGTLAPNAGFGLALEGFEAVAAWNRGYPDDPIRIVQISLALATTDVDHPFNLVADSLAQTGVLIVVAVGNNHEGAVVPATARKVLAVGATSMGNTVSRVDDGRASFSDVSSDAQLARGVLKPEIMAPGSLMWMPAKDSLDGYGSRGYEGTSFAAPLVSGVAALVLEANPQLHPAQVKEILLRSSEPRGTASGLRYTDVNLDFEDDLGDGGWDPRWGYGYVDAEEAVRLARETAPRRPPAPAQLTLHAGVEELATSPPTKSHIDTDGAASWSMTLSNATALGDGDPSTEETALLVLEAPGTSIGATSSRTIVDIYRNDTLLASHTRIDDRISTTAVSNEPLRLLVPLGKRSEVVLRGPDTGRLNVTGDLGVLDANGSIPLGAGDVLRLVVAVNHTSGAPSPLVTGRGATTLTVPLDPVTLPNLEAPGRVAGLGGYWNATSATLEWGPAPDDRGIGAYLIQREGVLVHEAEASRYKWTDAGLSPGSTYRYRVAAVDIHGVAGPLSEELIVVTPPAAGRAVVVDAAGASALATDLAANGSFAGWTAQLTPTRVGRQALRATLFEGGEAVHTRTTSLNVISAANRPPTISLDVGIGPLHGRRAIAVLVDDPDTREDIEVVEHRVDGGAWQPVGSDRFLLDARDLGAGTHVLEARVSDRSGATAIASAQIVSEPWTASIDVASLLRELVSAPAAVRVVGEGANETALRLVGAGAGSFTLDLPAGPFPRETAIPPILSGLLDLTLVAGADVLADRAVVVDAPPTAQIVALDLVGTRLESLTLLDGSHDDTGIARRAWHLPNGTISTEPVLVVPLDSLTVGSHEVRLEVHNANGLYANDSVTLVVEDLPPVVATSGFHVMDAPVDRVFTGENVTLVVDIADPEGDPLTIDGGLRVEGGLLPLAPGRNVLAVRPNTIGTLMLDLAVSDPWLTTVHARQVPVTLNTPPVAFFTGSANVSAGVYHPYDTSRSFDPDRPYLDRALVVEGVGTFTDLRPRIAFPMGVWNATLTVTDSSGAQATATRMIVADDALSLRVTLARTPSFTREAVVLVEAWWHDGSPAAGADVQLVAGPNGGVPISRTYSAQTDAEGRARIVLARDLGALDVPGQHYARATVSAASLPDAPIQDVERAMRAVVYNVGI